MEGSEGSQRDVRNITLRILAINFAAIHVSPYLVSCLSILTQLLCPRHLQM